jgi:peptidoglycan hydrolase-like protein with peptidoglycan-binding domain
MERPMPKRILTAAAAVLLLLGLPFVAKAAGDPLLYAVQEALLDEGYDPGWPDGVLGPQTRRAIRAFEADYSLPDTGTMTPGLVYALGLAAYATELGVMEFADVRMLAPPPGAEHFAVSTNAAVDTDVGARPQEATEGSRRWSRLLPGRLLQRAGARSRTCNRCSGFGISTRYCWIRRVPGVFRDRQPGGATLVATPIGRPMPAQDSSRSRNPARS